jgi:hypothetical protein
MLLIISSQYISKIISKTFTVTIVVIIVNLAPLPALFHLFCSSRCLVVKAIQLLCVPQKLSDMMWEGFWYKTTKIRAHNI